MLPFLEQTGRALEKTTVATPKVSNHYPRPGERIAPKTLRDFLMAPLPKRFWFGNVLCA